MQDTDNMSVIPPTDDEQGLRRKKRDKLPKFMLGRNEGFYISRDELTALNDSYNQMLSDMEESPAKEELRSYMESVIFTSYVSEIKKLQRENCLECEVERTRLEMLNSVLTPRRWRNWYWLFKLNRNQAQILLEELVSRQARSYYYNKESELPIVDEESEVELDPYEVQLETIRACLPKMRKKKRAIFEAMLAGLATSFESKEAKLRRMIAELQAEKAKVEELTAEAGNEAVKQLKEEEVVKDSIEDEEPIEEDEENIEEADSEEQSEEDEIDELENWDALEDLDDSDEESPEEDEPE